MSTRFLAADIFDPESDLKQLAGNVDVVYIASFLHLWGWDSQVQACVEIVKMTRGKGSIVLGRQVGNLTPGVKKTAMSPNGSIWVHNGESFEKLWKEVGKLTGTNWKVNVNMDEPFDVSGGKKWQEEGTRRLVFSVTRVE